MEKIIFEGKIPEITVEQIRRDTSFSMAQKHFHSSYEIYYLLEGERGYFIKNRAYRVRKGNLIFIGSNQIHKTTMAHSPVHERILLEISENLIQKFSDKLEKEVSQYPPFFARSGVLELNCREQSWVESLLFQIIDEIKAKRVAYFQAVNAYLEELLIFIFRKGHPDSKSTAIQSTKYQKVHEVATYICSNYAEIPSLDKLSERFYVSKYYLCRIFKEVTGMTVSQYVNANRLKAAERMLLQSSESVIKIAAASGFGNVTYFDKIFKKSLGVSPAQYRKENRNAGGNP